MYFRQLEPFPPEVESEVELGSDDPPYSEESREEELDSGELHSGLEQFELILRLIVWMMYEFSVLSVVKSPMIC